MPSPTGEKSGMNAELAEQLLYESEATLRLVDSLLGELQDMESHLPAGVAGMHALQLGASDDVDPDEDIPALLSSASSEALELLEALRRGRSVLERTSAEIRSRQDGPLEATAGRELRSGLERALLLVDRLESEQGASPVQSLLRDEILELLEGVRIQEITEQRLSYACSVLQETELRLAAIVQRLTPEPAKVVPFRAS